MKVHLSQHNHNCFAFRDGGGQNTNTRRHHVIENETKTSNGTHHAESNAALRGDRALLCETALSNKQGVTSCANDDVMPMMLTSNDAAWFVESWIVEYAIAYQHMSVIDS